MSRATGVFPQIVMKFRNILRFPIAIISLPPPLCFYKIKMKT
jgi:hypothetical protein